MQTQDSIQEICDFVEFEQHPDLDVVLGPSALGPSFFPRYLQIADPTLPETFNSGRKWTLSQHMTTSEVVQTIFLAYTTWLEHEARESFLYRGRAILAPHFNVDRLWELSKSPDAKEYREEV